MSQSLQSTYNAGDSKTHGLEEQTGAGGNDALSNAGNHTCLQALLVTLTETEFKNI